MDQINITANQRTSPIFGGGNSKSCINKAMATSGLSEKFRLLKLPGVNDAKRGRYSKKREILTNGE